MSIKIRDELYNVDGDYTEQQIDIFYQYYISGLNISQIAKYQKMRKDDVISCLTNNVELKRVFTQFVKSNQNKHKEE